MQSTPQPQTSRSGSTGAGPVVVLVRPQLAENVGMAARAMLNCGLDVLRLVEPREPLPHFKATRASAGADAVLDVAGQFDSLAPAVADLTAVYATTARARGMSQRVMTARAAATEIVGRMASGEKVGVLFGPERTGLTNDDTSFAEALITIPLNPAFSSLNLAQGVLLVAYEIAQARLGERALESRLEIGNSTPATKDELAGLFEHLERALDASRFLRVADKRPGMVRNIRNALQRATLTSQEVATFHGIVTELSKLGRKDEPKAGE